MIKSAQTWNSQVSKWSTNSSLMQTWPSSFGVQSRSSSTIFRPPRSRLNLDARSPYPHILFVNMASTMMFHQMWSIRSSLPSTLLLILVWTRSHQIDLIAANVAIRPLSLTCYWRSFLPTFCCHQRSDFSSTWPASIRDRLQLPTVADVGWCADAVIN